MSRSDSQKITDTGLNRSQTTFDQSEEAREKTQEGIQQYKDALAKYAGNNPYAKGGEYQTSQNEDLANNADATATASKEQLQEAALRGGQNRSVVAAASEKIAQQAGRDAAAQRADANQRRIASNADYNKSVLDSSTVPIQAEGNLYGTGLNASENYLNTAQGASASNRSFADQFGGAFASTLGNTLGGGNARISFSR